ncbi:peptidyl-tRNA hydrolase 2, mitochondrial-like isoform X2 [Macrosteles quadrilineatus]|uniref:peptidyl-tRNA hydrolase 2, mitochondrial-like isoform X2 n=1 Tax=Macrosteles quadrilineatus TaxID=74068 RepID=UPI0023E178C0|nr:peptidyl-tRNA hydrolase 2, mitochondrial-like isoform X2 [Macrosteles quadrilineatus]
MASLTSILSGFAFGFAAVVLWKGNMRGLLAAANSITQTSGEMKMALVVRTDLKLGKGKAAAQCAHAAVSCYKRALYDADKYLQQWEKEGQPKVVMATSGEQGLLTLARDAQKKGLIAIVIHDAGHTQIARGTATVVGIGPGPHDMVNSVVGQLKLF